jgi:hypothetical protein
LYFRERFPSSTIPLHIVNAVLLKGCNSDKSLATSGRRKGLRPEKDIALRQAELGSEPSKIEIGLGQRAVQIKCDGVQAATLIMLTILIVQTDEVNHRHQYSGGWAQPIRGNLLVKPV